MPCTLWRALLMYSINVFQWFSCQSILRPEMAKCSIEWHVQRYVGTAFNGEHFYDVNDVVPCIFSEISQTIFFIAKHTFRLNANKSPINIMTHVVLVASAELHTLISFFIWTVTIWLPLTLCTYNKLTDAENHCSIWFVPWVRTFVL